MSTATAESFARVQEHAAHIKSGDGPVRPGEPINMSPALGDDEKIAQGDFNLRLIDAAPKGYLEKCPIEKHDPRQLVPGNTQGAKHALDSLDGVKLFYPPKWGTDECLDGPVLVVGDADRVVEHPTHGNVNLPRNCVVDTWYQREYDAETKRARRAAD